MLERERSKAPSQQEKPPLQSLEEEVECRGHQRVLRQAAEGLRLISQRLEVNVLLLDLQKLRETQKLKEAASDHLHQRRRVQKHLPAQETAPNRVKVAVRRLQLQQHVQRVAQAKKRVPEDRLAVAPRKLQVVHETVQLQLKTCSRHMENTGRTQQLVKRPVNPLSQKVQVSGFQLTKILREG